MQQTKQTSAQQGTDDSDNEITDDSHAFLFCDGGIHSLGEVLAPSAVWKVFWSLLVGGLLALALRRWRTHMPAIPNGDVVVLGGKVANTASALGVGCGRLDGLLRRWQVAGTLLVSAIILLAVALGWR